MKKSVVIFSLLILTTTLFAQTINDFERLLQMKAVINASYGTYIKPDAPNPYDYYTVNTLRQISLSNNELIINSNLFYGVCAEYSIRMYKAITDNKAHFERMGMKQNQYYIAVSASNSYVDIFGRKNILGVSLELVYNMGDSIETYKIIDRYSYETTYYNEYAIYFAIHYSFLKFWNNRFFLGGTLGLGYHGVSETGEGSSYSSSGFNSSEFNGMIEDNISPGFAFKIGAYIMYSFDWFSIKTMLEYKSFGGVSLGLGFSILL